jgi:hypothetical protein
MSASGAGGGRQNTPSHEPKRFTIVCALAQRLRSTLILIDIPSFCHGTEICCAMAQRLGSNLILIDIHSLCHGTEKCCAMAHRLCSNLNLIDNDSLCHGTTILFRRIVQCMGG